ncbi:MAG: hypothetical protein RL497_1164 [Pseudomonadota bacterium]|jgi:hypothetical protein
MSSPTFNQNELVEQFKLAYATFDMATLKKLKELYDPNVIFVDPLHRIEGWTQLERYFLASAENLHYCRFDFDDTLADDNTAFLKWRMAYAHNKIANGKPLILNGVTKIKFNTHIIYHEDFYDLGAMLYEHIPIFGTLIKKLKSYIVRTSSRER